MTVNNNYPRPPQNIDNADFLRLLRQAVDYAMRGKLNCTGEVTLTQSATSTVVNNILCNENSVILLTPITANAASTSGIWVDAGDKAFTIHHHNVTHNDEIFRYVIIG